jgi:phage tail-like protein
MPSYSNLIYAGGYYGQQSRLAFSIQPFTSVAVGYDKVELTWAQLGNPEGAAFNAIRLVRNQVTFPETQEDGVILWEEYSLTGSPSLTTFEDGFDNFEDDNEHNDSPLIGGRFAYYRMWLRKDDDVWYRAGDTYVLIPQDHGTTAFTGTAAQTTHDKFMDLIPKVYTTATQSPLDNVDPESTLYTFLKGFSLTLDELLTYVDVLKPNYSGLSTPPPVVSLQAQQLGIPLEYSLGLRAMKKMVREAVFLHNNKGTALGVGTLAENLTGFSPTVTRTKNLMLTMQDSTFYKGLGNWLPGGSCTLTVEDSVYHDTSETNVSDKTYTAKVVASSASSFIFNGENKPKTLGIPVTAEEDYQLVFFALTSTASRSVTAKVTWYDYMGTAVGNASQTFSLTANTWAKNVSSSWEAPATAAYAAVRLSFSGAATFYLDKVQFALYESSTPSYEEARGVNVFLSPSKTNLIKNPSFEETTTLWDITDEENSLVESTLAQAVGLSQMLESVTNTDALTQYTTESDPGVSVGHFYTASLYAKTVLGTEEFELKLTATSGSDVTVETIGPVTLTNEWQRIHVTLFVPSTYDETTFLTVDFVGEETTGNTVHLDSVQLEASYLPTDYFDGEFPFEYGAMWAGTENESVSYLYPNKEIKIPRLIANLAEYMPIGTTYSVSTYDGLEYIGIS